MPDPQCKNSSGCSSENSCGEEIIFTLLFDSYKHGIKKLHVRDGIGLDNVPFLSREQQRFEEVINISGRFIRKEDFGEGYDREMKCSVDINPVIMLGSDNEALGLLIDVEFGVLDEGENIREMPRDFGNPFETGSLVGVTRINGGVNILIGIDKTSRNDDESYQAVGH